LVELELAGETEVLGENAPQCYFIHNFHMTWCATRTVVVGSRRITAWTMTWPPFENATKFYDLITLNFVNCLFVLLNLLRSLDVSCYWELNKYVLAFRMPKYWCKFVGMDKGGYSASLHNESLN
jgi:hypothetical protein